MTRIQFNKQGGYETLPAPVAGGDRGINKHNALVAFVKNLFSHLGICSKVFKYQATNGTIYINHESFNHWIERAITPYFPDIRPISAKELKNTATIKAIVDSVFSDKMTQVKAAVVEKYAALRVPAPVAAPAAQGAKSGGAAVVPATDTGNKTAEPEVF